MASSYASEVTSLADTNQLKKMGLLERLRNWNMALLSGVRYAGVMGPAP